MKKSIYIILAFFMVYPLICQESAEQIITKAMRDELKRNVENLSLEKLQKPFFLSYTVFDSKICNIKATLGGITLTKDIPVRNFDVKLLVGNYNLNNDNFVSADGAFSYSGGRSSMTIENDYYGIRRALWIDTDDEYKAKVENYEAKISAMKQQNLTSEDSLPDFTKVAAIKYNYSKSTLFEYDKAKWEDYARKVSEIFKSYKAINSSSVNIAFYNTTIYYINSEGTETVSQLPLAAIQINAATLASDGESLNDHILCYELNPNDLPTLEKMLTDTKALAENLIALKNAPSPSDAYTGPVLFEDQACAELFNQRLLTSNGGLVAERKGIYENSQFTMFLNNAKEETLTDKISKKVISPKLSVISIPKTTIFGNKKLIGSYQVDAEGVSPADETILIENGILKTLMSNRIPSTNMPESNGHRGYSINDSRISPSNGAAVIEIKSKDNKSNSELKKLLIEKAQEEGLDYAYIVRKLKVDNSGYKEEMSMSSIMSMAEGFGKKGVISKPIAIYRVDCKTGKEELVRGLSISDVTMNSMKNIEGTAGDNMVYNTISSNSGSGLSNVFSFVISSGSDQNTGISGKPISIISPSSVLLKEVEVKKEKRVITAKLPAVSNPIGN